MTHQISVLIPAHNEADYITACLRALFASAKHMPPEIPVEVLVAANGCRDDTAARARALFPPEGWHLRVLEQDHGSKTGALNLAEAAARGSILVYLDADVLIEPALLSQIAAALATDDARYVSGTPTVTPARSAITRAYAAFWTQLPFVRNGVPGFGLFAMTRAGRARWADWPDIISDDTFARLQFAPTERLRLPGRYQWPMVEGLRNLVRVRRRQDRGVQQIATLYPGLFRNDDKIRVTALGLAALARRSPLGFLAYGVVALGVRSPFFASREDRRKDWVRGR